MNFRGLPKVIAHRGNAAEYPENTLEALASAVALGVAGVELDVQMTADHVPVVLHDSTLLRVADNPASVHDLSWDQLSRISVGESQRFGSAHCDVYPSSLKQFAAALASWPGITAFVEVKRESLQRFGTETVMSRVLADLYEVRERCVIISFDDACLAVARRMTGTRIGWVVSDYSDASQARAQEMQPEFLFGDIASVPTTMARLWQGDWQWAMYEVRDLATVRRCHALGAACIETMQVRSLLAEYGSA